LEKNGGAFLSSSDQASAGTLGGHSMWRDRRGTPLLQDYSDVAGSIDNGTAPGTMNDVLSPLLSISAVVSNFTLDPKARYTATLNLGVKEVEFNGQPWADPQKALGESYSVAGTATSKGYSYDFTAGSKFLAFSEKNAILANGW